MTPTTEDLTINALAAAYDRESDDCACGHPWSEHRLGVGCCDTGGWDGYGWRGCPCNVEPAAEHGGKDGP